MGWGEGCGNRRGWWNGLGTHVTGLDDWLGVSRTALEDHGLRLVAPAIDPILDQESLGGAELHPFRLAEES